MTPMVIFISVLGITLAYALNHIAGAMQPIIDDGDIAAFVGTGDFIGRSFVEHPLPFTTPFALSVALLGLLIALILFIWQSWWLNKTSMAGREHGSAKILGVKDLKPYCDSDSPKNNILLGDGVSIRLDGHAKNHEYERNSNVLVVGGSGCGKTWRYVLPNLMQLNSSYVLTDPKGTTVTQIGKFFLENKYKVKILNTVNFEKSMHYNPLAYIYKQSDILRVVEVIMASTTGTQNDTGDPFWPNAERLFYSSVIALQYEWCNASELNLPTTIDLIALAEIREDNPDYTSTLDELFEMYKEELVGTGKDPNSSFACRQYHRFKQGNAKTLQSVLISCNARLARFDLDEVRELMSYDEIGLDQIGREKTFLGVVMSDTEKTYSFIIALMEYQLFNVLCVQADENPDGQLDIPVQLYLDEFRNIGRIPDFDTTISTIRSRGISASIILQSLAQLHDLYKDAADTIIDCCDTLVFFGGGRSKTTTEAISGYIGQSTIETKSRSESRSGSGGNSVSHQVVGRAAIDPAEIAKLKKSECLIHITGSNAAKVEKIMPTKNPMYKTTGFGNPELRFSIGDEKLYEAEHFLDGVIPREELSDAA
ncbi:conjugal transfer protein TraG [Actinomycetota bacterium]|nr:conjugal transfer protein TraG [Actinomycetota bacterium]